MVVGVFLLAFLIRLHQKAISLSIMIGTILLGLMLSYEVSNFFYLPYEELLYIAIKGLPKEYSAFKIAIRTRSTKCWKYILKIAQINYKSISKI